jgi:sodium/bile acid cotransporter 7
MRLPRIDPYVIGIAVAVLAAVVVPIRGELAVTFALVTKIAVGVLFFLYGARLPREAVLAGLIRWRLHLLILSITFVVFPLVSLLWRAIPTSLLGPGLVAGLTYVCCLPSTVQSNVALVAAGRGDVAAAVCSASASNLLGVLVSPLLVALLMHSSGATVSVDAIEGVVIQLLLPFALGQLVHPWAARWMERHRGRLIYYDRLTIMMIVYGAFSSAVIGGIWTRVAPWQLAVVFVLCALLFTAIITLGVRASRLLGFPVEDEIVVAICGTQKGMVVGVPMASLLFPPDQVGLILLPLLIYHPLQLMSCAVIAGRYATRSEVARSAA